MENLDNNLNDLENQNPKKPKKSKKKIIIIVAIIILLILVGLVGGGYYYVNNSLNKLDRVNINTKNLGINKQMSSIDQTQGITNVVIFGVDEPKGTPGRSDTIMIATINQNNDTLKLTSIMRDSYVNIPGYGMNKINAAYAFGGPTLALKTLNEDYGMNLKYYVTEDFTTLPTLVTLLHGVTVTLSQAEINAMVAPQDQLNSIFHANAPILTKPGTYTLDGIQAMAYSRIRDGVGGDYARTYRQRQMMQQLYTKIKALPVTEIPGMINKLIPTIQTNLTNEQIMNLGEEILKMGVPTIQQARFPLNSQSHGEMISGQWYLAFNQEQTTDELHDFIYKNQAMPNPEYDS